MSFILYICPVFYDLFIEILGGVLSAIITVLFVVFIFRPSIKISPFICTDDDGHYFIKIINNDFISKAVYLKFECLVLKPQSATGGQNYRLKKLSLQTDDLFYLHSKTIKNNGKNCFIARINEENLDKEWLETDTLVFKVMANHGVTGFPRVIQEEYRDKSSIIKKGKFRFGNAMKVIEGKSYQLS